MKLQSTVISGLSQCQFKSISRKATWKTGLNIQLKLCHSAAGVGGRRLKWSYLHGAATGPLIGNTIGQLLALQADKRPDTEAMVFPRDNVRLTFSQLLQQSDQLAAGLLALGIKRGDRVGIWSPNNVQWILAQYGTARAGIVMVNVNPSYQAPELEYALKKAGLKALICAENFRTSKYYNILHTVCPELDNCAPNDLNSKKLPDLKAVIMISKKKFAGTLSFDELMSAGSPKDTKTVLDLQNELQFDDPINIQFTSGTTGKPKGATLTHHNIVNNAKFTGERLNYTSDSRICVPVPLYHCFGMVMGSLQSVVYGSTCVFPSPGFEPETTLKAVERERCSSLYGTPTMFIDMLNLLQRHQFNLQSLETGIMAGSPCPEEVMRRVIEEMNMSKVTICYGTTENSPVTFQTYQTDSLDRRVSTIGTPHPHIEAKVVNEQGHVVPVGVKGELLIRGYGVMLGYWNDEEKTRQVIQADRWYRTGDVAVLDEYGYGRIVSRLNDVIIRGGENIYPVEVEQVLYTHPKVAEAQVIGVPDKRLGEQVCCWLKLKDAQSTTVEDIKQFCADKLAHFKIPHYIFFVTEFPLTVTGKVQKFRMREKTIDMLKLDSTGSVHFDGYPQL